MHVQVKRLRPNAVIPEFKTAMAAGYDLSACLDEPLVLLPGAVAMIPTGIAIYIGQSGYAAMMYPRRGFGTRGLVLGNLTGVIDADYQGEVGIVAWNRTEGANARHFTIHHGDRIAQLVFTLVTRPHLVEVAEFNEQTARGAGGYGSTGVRAA
jgi:dUTP pyrophosphatase